MAIRALTFSSCGTGTSEGPDWMTLIIGFCVIFCKKQMFNLQLLFYPDLVYHLFIYNLMINL